MCVAGDVARPGYDVVGRPELLEGDAAVWSDYDPTATTNGARFQADVVLYLARHARERDPQGPPLFIGYEDWFSGVSGGGPDARRTRRRCTRCCPIDTEVIWEVDYRADRVIRKVERGPMPELAVNVRIWWENQPGKPDRYSYLDTLSTPHFKVTNRWLITYRLLDFGDWFAYDEIEGVTGRPTSGLLGFLFRTIGEGRIKQSRMAISKDGAQVSRATAQKGFMERTTTVTVYPDGKMVKDVPAGRPDLLEPEKRIKQPLEIDYVKLPGDR